MTTSTQKMAKFEWSDTCEKNFQKLKDRLTSASVLTLPKGTNSCVVYCDASRVELRCVFMQHGKVMPMLQGNLRFMRRIIRPMIFNQPR